MTRIVSLVLITLNLVLVSAIEIKAGKFFQSKEGKVRLVQGRTTPLRENMTMLSDIESIVPLRNGGFVATSMKVANVVIYDSKGNQVRTIGRWGGAPYEYRAPLLVRSYHDTIIVWDAMAAKFIFFGLSGNPIRELTGFREAINDFLFVGDQIILYLAGGISKKFIAIHDIKKARTVTSIGERSKEHDIFMMYYKSGGLTQYAKDCFLFASPAKSVVYSWCPPNQLSEKKIHDSDFRVEPDKKNLLQGKTKETWKQIKTFLLNNSRVCGVYALDKHVVVQIENGSEENHTRTTKLIVLNKDLSYVDAISLQHAEREEFSKLARFSNGQSLYFLREVSSDAGASLQRSIVEFKISS